MIAALALTLALAPGYTLAGSTWDCQPIEYRINPTSLDPGDIDSIHAAFRAVHARTLIPVRYLGGTGRHPTRPRHGVTIVMARPLPDYAAAQLAHTAALTALLGPLNATMTAQTLDVTGVIHGGIPIGTIYVGADPVSALYVGPDLVWDG